MWPSWRKRCGFGRVATCPASGVSASNPHILLCSCIIILQLASHIRTITAYPMQSYQMYGNGYANTGVQQQAPVNTYADYRMNPATNHYPQYPSPYSVHRDVGWIGGGQPLAAYTGWPSASHMSPYSMQPMKLSVVSMANRLMNRPPSSPYLAKVAGQTPSLSHTLPLAPLRLASVSSSPMSRNLIDTYPSGLTLQRSRLRQLLRPPSIPILQQKAVTLLRFPSESLFVP